MFCKWCGNKITNNGIPCPSCGRDQDALESGNGFWDLCSIRPTKGVLSPNSENVSVQEKRVSISIAAEENSGPQTSEHKHSKSRAKLLHIITVFLLLIALAAIGIGIRQTDTCLSEMAALRLELASVNEPCLTEMAIIHSEIASVNEFVSDGFEEIAEYHAAISNPADDQSLEGAKHSIDELPKNNQAMLFPFLNYRLLIERYELEAESAYTVLIASGSILTDKNTETYWTRSIDAGATWQTIAENTPYLVTEHCEEAIYRVHVLMDCGAGEKKITGYADISDNGEFTWGDSVQP